MCAGRRHDRGGVSRRVLPHEHLRLSVGGGGAELPPRYRRVQFARRTLASCRTEHAGTRPFPQRRRATQRGRTDFCRLGIPHRGTHRHCDKPTPSSRLAGNDGLGGGDWTRRRSLPQECRDTGKHAEGAVAQETGLRQLGRRRLPQRGTRHDARPRRRRDRLPRPSRHASLGLFSEQSQGATQ